MPRQRQQWLYGRRWNMGFSEAAINIEKYFKEHLPSYEVVEARRKSGHVEDAHLFMVAARKDSGEYAVWTCWNEKLQTLNHGHYDIGDLQTCHKIMDEFYRGKG